VAQDERDYKSFVKSLKKLKPKQLHLFYGPEVFLFEESLEKLKLIILGKDISSFNFTVYDGDICSGRDILNAIQTLPLFSGNRMVVVKRVDKLGSEDTTELLSVFEDMPELSYVVFQSNSEKLDGRLKFVKLCRSKGTVVNLRRLYPSQLVLWIKARAKALGVKMDEDALGLFMTMVGNDLWSVENELTKLAVYQSTGSGIVTEETIKLVAASSAEKDIFDVIDAIAEKDTKQALILSSQMLHGGTPLPLMLALIVRQLTLLLKTKLVLEGNSFISAQNLARILSITPYAGQKCLKQHERFTFRELKTALTDLAKAEKSIKTGEGDGLLALELAILSVVAA
jgi:DNA polymerase-3 subunit delta